MLSDASVKIPFCDNGALIKKDGLTVGGGKSEGNTHSRRKFFRIGRAGEIFCSVRKKNDVLRRERRYVADATGVAPFILRLVKEQMLLPSFLFVIVFGYASFTHAVCGNVIYSAFAFQHIGMI